MTTLPEPSRWRLLSPLLDELLEQSAAERQRRLGELRGRDSGLADELEVLLGASGRAQATHFLAGDAQADGMPAALIGRQIGAYVIEAHLGQGGTGSVWRARRADGRFEGAVAVKLLHLSLIGRAGALRFEREGAILAKLTHPNIARLLDAGVTADGQPYLVLELVEGERIDRHCDTRQLGIEQRLALFDAVLAAVAHAHSHLVIHRDIKPTNILVSADGSVKLLDFGIAKLLEDERGGATVTAEGQFALTPEYAAPEQMQGGPVTTATDVYALGVLLYQLLAGRHPTAADATSSAEIIRTTLETEPPRLAHALDARDAHGDEQVRQVAAARGSSPARLRRRLRGDLENIVARALRKEASQRYQGVAALADDLRRHLANEPVSAQPDSLAYRCVKFARRNRRAVAVAALVLLAVSAGLVGTITQAQRAERERDNALHQLAYAESGSEFISFLLEESADKPFRTPELLARGEVLVEQQFADDPAQRAHLQRLLGGLHAQANDTDKAMALLRRAQEAARRDTDLSLQTDIECQIAAQHSTAGAFDLARRMFDAALARLRTLSSSDPGSLAGCLFQSSEAHNYRGEPAAALADAQAALDLLGTPRPGQRTLAIQLRTALADSQGNLGRSADAVDAYRWALAELDAMGRGRTQLAVALYNNLGRLLSIAGQPLQAAQAYEQALTVERGFGGAAPEATLLGNYAKMLTELGRPREAMPLIEQALAEAEAKGNQHFLVPAIALQGAPAWCAVEDLARCAELLASARAGLSVALPAGHPRLGTLETVQAQLALQRADPSQARVALERAVAIFDAATDSNRAGIRALTLLARTEQQLGALDAAEAHAARAVAQARAALAGFPHSEWLGSALVAQGLVEQARGQPAAAQAAWRAAQVELQATAGAAAPASAEVARLLAANP